jgi:hypothetical protein
MAMGAGKYDAICTAVREETKANTVILLILDGVKGSGLSVQAPLGIQMNLPRILRDVADDIERGK